MVKLWFKKSDQIETLAADDGTTNSDSQEKTLSSTEVIPTTDDNERYDNLQSKIQPKDGLYLTKLLIGKTPKPIDPHKKKYPLLNASIFSVITFSWISEIIKKGYLRRIEDEDLYLMEGEFAVQECTRLFEENLQKRIDAFRKKNPSSVKYSKWVIIMAINDTFRTRFWIQGGLSKVASDVTQVTLPLLVRQLVKYVQHKDDPDYTGTRGQAIGYSIGLSLMLLFNSVAVSNFFHGGMLTGAQTKAVLTNLIYKKAFKLSSRAKFEFPNGKINTLVMTDMSRIDIAIGCFHFLWSFPIGLSVAIIILCVTLGATALLGVAIVLLVLITVFMVNKKLRLLRRKSIVFIDKRVTAISEVINNLKMVKFYSWEGPYLNLIQAFRKSEKDFIFKMEMWKSFLNTSISSVTYVATLATFLLLFYHSSGHFQSYNIFSAISMFNMLRTPLNILPMATAFATDALIALERVADFLQAEESEDIVEKLPVDASENSIEITDSTFQWDVEDAENFSPTPNANKKSSAKVTPLPSRSANLDAESSQSEERGFPGLVNISLAVKRHEFIVITGSIGSGKSSLLNAIEGSMKRIQGDLKIYGSLSFCSYPWVQNTSIRNNIIFGKAFDKKWYDDIVKACALDVDFASFPQGDQTEVGERGITLSGGQKARINLARAVYADRDIILLDDVLSAVDARVGRHIMNECITGLLKDKTRLLATHQLSLIGAADKIVYLDGTGQITVGTQAELMKSCVGFANLMQYSKEIEDTEDEIDEEIAKIEAEFLVRQKTEISRITSKGEESEESEEEEEGGVKEAGIAESRGVNSISFSIYADYLKLGSGLKKYISIPLALFILASNGFLQVFQSVWLTFWLSDKFGYSSDTYAGLYGLFTCLGIISYVVLFTLMSSVNNRAGLKLFNLSISKVMQTPMWFLDVTPIGRILNRFTKDTDVVDTEMVDQLRLFLSSISLVGATIVLCGIYIPWFFIAVPPCLMLYYHLSNYYQTSALDIKRLEATKRSHVFGHFNESLVGMKVIKSYEVTDLFFKRFDVLQDNMNSAYFLTFGNQRWLAMRLDCVSSCVSLFVSMLCVNSVFHLSAASAGLLVSYIIQVSTLVSLLIRSMTQVENYFNSVERLFEYANDLPEEGPFQNEATKPEESWPSHGAIEFQNVFLSYREGLPSVLKDVSFSVKAGEKIGICGRTGAGKSTIMNALFRVSELSSGKVSIDDIDISTIGLDDLRSNLSIIPQDPVLFRGTIRQNLDPFDKTDDAQLWDALRRSWLIEEGAQGLNAYSYGKDNLKTFHKFHLDQLVEDDGANFSLGERQLLALARALVRNSKILILDEATSSVDYETDAMIQSTIANEFSNCSILCIAHRLKTILNYDKILVLDSGEVREFDTPFNLFKSNGIFTEMCQKSSITEKDFIGL